MDQARFCYIAGCCAALVLGAITSSPTTDAAVLMTNLGTTSLRNNGSSNYGGTIGYSFTVNTSGLIVTTLGVYDAEGNSDMPNSGSVGDGLEDQAPVGLYSEDGSLLASVIIPVDGNASTLAGGFRYVTLSGNVALTAGQTYVLAMGVDHGGNGFLNRSSSTAGVAEFSDDFTYVQEWYINSGGSSSLTFPTNSSEYSAFVGPNFQYIPEPASLALLGLGSLMMFGDRRRVIP